MLVHYLDFCGIRDLEPMIQRAEKDPKDGTLVVVGSEDPHARQSEGALVRQWAKRHGVTAEWQRARMGWVIRRG